MLDVGGNVLFQVAARAAAHVDHLDVGRVRVAVLARQIDELVQDERLDPVVEAAHADDPRLVAMLDATVLDFVVVLGDHPAIAAAAAAVAVAAAAAVHLFKSSFHCHSGDLISLSSWNFRKLF